MMFSKVTQTKWDYIVEQYKWKFYLSNCVLESRCIFASVNGVFSGWGEHAQVITWTNDDNIVNWKPTKKIQWNTNKIQAKLFENVVCKI